MRHCIGIVYDGHPIALIFSFSLCLEFRLEVELKD